MSVEYSGCHNGSCLASNVSTEKGALRLFWFFGESCMPEEQKRCCQRCAYLKGVTASAPGQVARRAKGGMSTCALGRGSHWFVVRNCSGCLLAAGRYGHMYQLRVGPSVLPAVGGESSSAGSDDHLHSVQGAAGWGADETCQVPALAPRAITAFRETEGKGILAPPQIVVLYMADTCSEMHVAFSICHGRSVVFK